MRRRGLIVVSMVALAALVACAQQETPGQTPVEQTMENVEATVADTEIVATAVLEDGSGEQVGLVTFTQDDDHVVIEGEVHGVAGAGQHGFHIHESGECVAPDFTSAGGHFNPNGMPHACPPEPSRHAGDLGNIEVDAEGHGTVSMDSDKFTLGPGELSVVGRAVILHEGEDDCTSQPTGDAGARLACGRIVLQGAADMPDMGEAEGAEEGGEAGDTGY